MSLTKSEIEMFLKNKDEFIKIDYLNRFLKQADNIDVKKFIYLNLALINEKKGFFSGAIKNVASAAEISLTYREKKELYLKEADLWIRASDFNMADKAIQKAYSYANLEERQILQNQYLDLYRAIAKNLEDNGKIRKAINVYERLISMPQTPEKKLDAKEKLLALYEKSGQIRDHDRLKRLNI